MSIFGAGETKAGDLAKSTKPAPDGDAAKMKPIEAGNTPLSARDLDYVPLRFVLDEAYSQSAHGKGRVRHANDKSFTEQPIMTIGRDVGPGFPMGQAMKKIGEASRMLKRDESDAAIQEMLGAIVYLCASVILVREERQSSLDKVVS